jgi:hypothetical protein
MKSLNKSVNFYVAAHSPKKPTNLNQAKHSTAENNPLFATNQRSNSKPSYFGSNSNNATHSTFQTQSGGKNRQQNITLTNSTIPTSSSHSQQLPPAVTSLVNKIYSELEYCEKLHQYIQNQGGKTNNYRYDFAHQKKLAQGYLFSITHKNVNISGGAASNSRQSQPVNIELLNKMHEGLQNEINDLTSMVVEQFSLNYLNKIEEATQNNSADLLEAFINDIRLLQPEIPQFTNLQEKVTPYHINRCRQGLNQQFLKGNNLIPQIKNQLATTAGPRIITKLPTLIKKLRACNTIFQDISHKYTIRDNSQSKFSAYGFHMSFNVITRMVNITLNDIEAIGIYHINLR